MHILETTFTQIYPPIMWLDDISNWFLSFCRFLDDSADKGQALDPRLAELVQDSNALPNYFFDSVSDKSIYKNTTLTFVHYPKAGGTTVKDCINRLSEKYGKADPYTVFARNAGETKEAMLNGGLTYVDIFMGTYGFSLCQYLQPKRCAYFTVLREPYDRMISHYFFCKYGGVSNAPCNQTIEEFAILVRSVFFHQLTYLHKCRKEDPDGGQSSWSSKWRCDRDHLEIGQILEYNFAEMDKVLDHAERHLEDMFAVVGLLEDLETTFRLLQEAFGLPFYDECKQLHSNSKPKESDDRAQERIRLKKRLLEDKTVQLVMNADVRLYQKAKKIFEVQKARSNSFKSN